MPFERNIELKPIDESGERTVWQLVDKAVYRSVEKNLIIVIPQGFKTDLASVPRLPLLWLLAGGTGASAAVVHDYLYGRAVVSRPIADDVFFEIMEETRLPLWRCWLMFAAVRIFGGPAYGRRRKRKSWG